MTNSDYVINLLENHFELIKIYFQERLISTQISSSEFENLSKTVFKQLNMNLRAQVSERDFLSFCKKNKSRLLDSTLNV